MELSKYSLVIEMPHLRVGYIAGNNLSARLEYTALINHYLTPSYTYLFFSSERERECVCVCVCCIYKLYVCNTN